VTSRAVKILGGMLALAMTFAGYWALRLAYADHLAQSDSPEQLQAALRLAPGQAGYWLHLAEVQQAAGEPDSLALAHAAQLDPYDAAIWIRAGLDAELSGDLIRAERDLLMAAHRSRQFEPRWTLANFYFRQGNAGQFWKWTRSALAWAPGDRTLLFDLCWKMQPDAGVILSRAIPETPAVLRDYLWFLLQRRQWDATLPVAEKLEARASVDDRDLLLAYANSMLEQHRWDVARSAWNALCQRRLVHYAALDPARGGVLTNGRFAAIPTNTGFDWRIPDVKGIAALYNADPRWLRFDYSGEQPENCDAVYQLVPVLAGARYALRFAYRTENIPPQSGLQWRVEDAATHKPIPVSTSGLASHDWTTASLPFTVPSGVRALQVALSYRRQPGTVLIEGSIWLRDVGLERLP
jgi:hypothetical protein